MSERAATISARAAAGARPRLPRRASLGLATLLLGGCVTHSSTTHTSRSSQQITQNNKDAAAYNVQLGIAYMNQGDLVRAKDKLDRAVSQDPENGDVHSARALRLAPNDPKVVNNYAVYLCQIGRTDEGVKRFLEAARNPLYPTPDVAYTNAGVCLRTAKRDDEARTDFIRALQLKPNSAEAAFQFADLQFQRGELSSARTLIDGFITTYSATPDLLLLGARVARKQGDRPAAQRYARRLQLDFPDSDQARALAALEHNPG